MRLHRRAGARTALVSTAALALLAAGCSTTEAGSAATVGSTSISERSLQDQVRSYLDSLPAAQRKQKEAALAPVQTAILTAMVDEAVVSKVAAAKGVSVTPAQVSARVQSDIAAGGAQLPSQLASLYLTMASLPAFEQTNLLFLGLRQAIGAGKLSDTEAQAKVFTYVADQAKTLPVRLSPRYGVWNTSELSLSGGPQSISTPMATSGATSAS